MNETFILNMREWKKNELNKQKSNYINILYTKTNRFYDFNLI